MSNWITDSQDEQSLEELFRDADQIHIPIFQREYVWGQTELNHLCQDILLILESLESSQFLGAIVAYERTRPTHIVGRMKVIDVVDGQQRLLTLYIFVLALAERIYQYDSTASAEIIQEFLLLSARRGLDVNTRIVPSFDDRNQFRAIWDRINSPELMKSILVSNPPKPPLPSGKSSGKLDSQYLRINTWLKKQTPSQPDEAVAYLRSVLDIVTQKLTFVHLKLTDASVATKIFERLNFRGVRVDIGDLVRNEVFARSSQNTGLDLELYETVWRPFESKFQGQEELFYFPYCLIHNSNVKKSELFSELRDIWKGFGPKDIVDHMQGYQAVFLDIVKGDTHYNDKGLNQQVIRLYNLKIPSAIYPFVMQVLYHFKTGKVSLSCTKDLLAFTESFIVRRSVLGFEPTGLHSLFKGLWNDIQMDISVPRLKSEIFKRQTIQYPNDKEIRTALFNRPLAKAKICNFLLTEYDKSIQGDNPMDVPTIEHILPQTYSENSDWANNFTKESHKKYVDVLANLIPLSSPLNSSIQASSFAIKRERYRNESMFKAPRNLYEQWSAWSPESIDERSAILYDWFVTRWVE